MILAIAGALGVLLPVALASATRTVNTTHARSTLARATVADGTTETDAGTTGTDDTTVVVGGNAPTAVVGQSANVDYSTGTVLVEVPGSNTFVNLLSLQQVPIGSIINATKGLLELTFALPNGATQTATFWKGEFTVTQSSAGAVDLTLVGGSFAGCPRPPKKKAKTHSAGAATAGAAKAKSSEKPGTKVRSLWANATGNFKTTGKSGAAAVLGTEWLTIDQCNGTFFFVKKASNDPNGEIRVTVFYPHRHTVLLTRGHFLLAPARGYR